MNDLDEILQEIPNLRAVKRTYSQRKTVKCTDTGLTTPPPSSSPPPASPVSCFKTSTRMTQTVARSSMSLFGTGPKGSKLSKKPKTAEGKPKALVQMHLNLLPARVTCKECAMSYTRTSSSDVALHDTFHKAHLHGILVPPSMQSTRSPMNTKIPKVLNASIETVRLGLCRPHEQSFVTKVCEMVDLELNSALPPMDSTYTAYLSIHNNRCISFLLVQSTTIAFPFLTNGELDRDRARQVAIGVSRMWTGKNYRRKGLMKQLVDHARCKFVFGSSLEIDEIGFTQLSQSGEAFARSYTQSETPLVYTD